MNNITVSFTCLLHEEVSYIALVYIAVIVSYSLPIFLFVSLCYACFWRDTHTIYVLCAVMLNALWCLSVKEMTRIDRPRQWCSAVQYIGHSMPSVYSSVAVFISTYYCYQFWCHARDVWTTKTLFTRIIIILSYAALICYTRIFLVLARPEDVLVGSIIGTTSTILFLSVLRRQRYTQYKSALKSD